MNNKEINATINVQIFDEDLTIDDICSPLEAEGWCIKNAWIKEEGNQMSEQDTTTFPLSKEQLEILSNVFVHHANPMQPQSVWNWDEAERIEMKEYTAICDGLRNALKEGN